MDEEKKVDEENKDILENKKNKENKDVRKIIIIFKTEEYASNLD